MQCFKCRLIEIRGGTQVGIRVTCPLMAGSSGGARVFLQRWLMIVLFFILMVWSRWEGGWGVGGDRGGGREDYGSNAKLVLCLFSMLGGGGVLRGGVTPPEYAGKVMMELMLFSSTYH